MVYRTSLERGTAVSVSTQVTTTQVVTETSTVELDTTNIATLLADFANAKLAIKELEKVKSELDNTIRELLGSAKVGTVAGLPVVELAPRSRTTVDSALLKVTHPEAFETCSKVSTYDIIVAK
jgi:predicted phage-related endonuclease